MRPQKIITLQGNTKGDKCEVEVWDGCMLLAVYNSVDNESTGEVILLNKEQVDRLKVQIDRYYDTLTEYELPRGKVIYGTKWYDEQS